MSRSIHPLVLAFLTLLASCSSVTAPVTSSDDAAVVKVDPAGRDEIRADLAEARQELALAELEAAHAIEVAKTELGLAQHDQSIAYSELQGSDAKMAVELSDAQLDHDRDESRLAETNAELGELAAMYAEEEFAQTTKELVLERGRRQVRLAQKALEISTARLEVRRDELALERAAAQRGVSAAELACAKAEHGLKVAELRGALEIQRAERAVRELEAKLAEEKAES